MNVVVDEESVPLLLGSNATAIPNEKNPYQLISTHDIREILKESPKQEIRNRVIWRICFVVITLSVLGLLATTTQMGIQFYVTSLKSTSTPPTDENTPIGGLVGALRKHPPIGKMISPRVFPVKSLTETNEDMDNPEVSKEERESMSNNNNNKGKETLPTMVEEGNEEEEEEEEEKEDLSTTTESVVMPGSPIDPLLGSQREKKNSVLTTIENILPAPTTTSKRNVRFR